MEFQKAVDYAKYLTRVGLLSVAMSNSGCITQSSELGRQNITPVATAVVTLGIPIPESIFQSYPELRSSGLSVSELTSIPVVSKTPTWIFNLTNYRLRVGAMYDLYYYMEHLSNSSPPTSFQFIYEGEIKVARLSPLTESGFRFREMVFVPGGTQHPNWPSYGLLDQAQAATNLQSNLRVFSYVDVAGRVRTPFVTAQEGATFGAGVEVCQQTARVAVFDLRGQLRADSIEEYHAQEIICNSLGLYWAFRVLGRSFEEYSEYSRTHVLINPVSQKPDTFYVVSENLYNSTKQSGAVLE